MEQKNYITYKDKYNKKYGYTKGKSHTLEQVSKDTGVSMKGLQQIYNKGIGAYKTNPQSVRPNVKSKEQWAMARVYSSVMGGKASNIDSNELKMETGGIARRYDGGGKIDFTFENLPDDYKEVYQIRAYKNIGGQNYYFARLNTYGEENVFIIENQQGNEIARATLNEKDNYLINIRVDENYRRKGLALNLYDFIEKIIGVKLNPSPDKISKEAKELWMKRNPDIRFEDGGSVDDAISKLTSVTPQQKSTIKRIVSTIERANGKQTISVLNIRKGHIVLLVFNVRDKVESITTTTYCDVEINTKGNVTKGFYNYLTPKVETKYPYMEKGGMTRKFAEGGKITQYEIEAMRNYINGTNPNPKLKESFEKVLRKFGVDLERSDLKEFPKGKYVNTYDFSGYEYMRKINEEAGVSFLLTGEYQLVSKAIYEKDYSMWLFYNYLGRINISFKACENWLAQAQSYFEYTMPVPIWLVHTPRAKDGRSYALWIATTDKEGAEGRIQRPVNFEYDGRWYYQEIGMVGNFDFNNDGWGTLYTEKKTGLLIPEYTETSFHFNTLIHEFAHCLDFQTQLLANIDKYETKQAKKVESLVDSEINTETMTDAEKAIYAKQLIIEGNKEKVVALPITNHFTEFVDSLIRVLRACADGHIPLTQLYEQQALDVQQALAGKYGDLLLEQREKRAKEAKELAKADEMRSNIRFTWQSSWVFDIKEYAYQHSVIEDLKEKLKSSSKYALNLVEALELDNLITSYFNNEFKKYMLKNPSKATERLEDIKRLKKETNRIINNHFDNIKSNYEFGFAPSNELELYIRDNCDIRNFRDYKSWKDCAKEKLQAFQ
jgi:hypothetical protein